MKKHKLLAVFLALVLTLTLLPTAALAENEEAQIGETKYQTLAEAINAAGTGYVGTEITLLTDVTLTEQLNIDKTITLNGNGNTIKAGNESWPTSDPQKYVLLVTGNNVKLQNVTVDGNNQALGCVQFYCVTGGQVEDVTVKNVSQLGLNVNASQVTATGTFTQVDTGWEGGLNVSYGKNISNGQGCSFDASAATITGVSSLYSDAGDVSRATAAEKTISITAPAGWGWVNTINGSSGIRGYLPTAEAKVGNNYYYTFADAVAAAQDGDTVTLLDNVNITYQIEISSGKNIVLNMNGYNITATPGTTFKVSDGGLNVTGRGTITANGEAFRLVGNNDAATWNETSKPAELTVGENVTVISNTDCCVFFYGKGAVANVYGSLTSKGQYATIQGNGTYNNTTNNGGTVVNIYSGSVVENTASMAIYSPQVFSTTNVYGGTISGKTTGIELRAGTLNITGGTVSSSAESFSCDPNGSGSTTEGAAIAIAQHTTKTDITVSISGGTFTGIKALNESNPQQNDPAPQISLTVSGGSFNGEVSTVDVYNFITGGTFSSNPDAAYLAPGYKVVDSYRVIPSNSYKVTFDANGGTCNVTSGYTLEMGGLPTPTHSGSYAFVGWYTTDGTQVTALSQITADTALTARWSYIGGSSSGGSSSGSNTTTSTTTNKDGSTTTTTTNKTTGTVTETTKETDGTTTTVETKKDGTVTETVKTPEGTTGTVVTDKNGDVTEVKSTVSSTAAKEAAKTGEAVTLPVEVPAAASTEDAPAVQVSVPKSAGSVKVEIPVEKVTPGTVAVIVNADGTEKIVSTSVVTEDGVALTLNGNATVKVIDNSKDFIDVPENNVFYNEISSLSAREIMVGKTEDTFDLHNSVTLNQIANVAGRITGAVDVKDFNAGIVWGAENGLKTGDAAATRGDVLKALYVAAGSPAVADTSILGIFNDSANIPADMAAIVAWAAQNGILKGTADGNANLGVNVTRGQACALAGRAMGALA